MLLSATWGLGAAIAQGEVVADRYVISREGKLLDSTTGRKTHSVSCVHGNGRVDRDIAEEPCLNQAQLSELADYLVRAEEIVGGATEIEWAMDEAGIKLVSDVKMFSHLANIGDTRSLIIHPWSTTHSQLTEEERVAAGAGPDVVRLSVGIEDVADIIADLEQALA